MNEVNLDLLRKSILNDDFKNALKIAKENIIDYIGCMVNYYKGNISSEILFCNGILANSTLRNDYLYEKFGNNVEITSHFIRGNKRFRDAIINKLNEEGIKAREVKINDDSYDLLIDLSPEFLNKKDRENLINFLNTTTTNLKEKSTYKDSPYLKETNYEIRSIIKELKRENNADVFFLTLDMKGNIYTLLDLNSELNNPIRPSDFNIEHIINNLRFY
ncbi:hypothetical protein Bp8pS_195 [Bacillus phage vB_BpuM-BpSp]|nr:hypothetical protein Bp8pS_195 [Bacillus phage vB_BpuM-BpSp]